MGKTWRERTPEQTDDTNEHEPEVRRYDGEVNHLGWCVYGPEITAEGKSEGGCICSRVYLQPQHTNYVAASGRMPIPRKERYRVVSDRSEEKAHKNPAGVHD